MFVYRYRDEPSSLNHQPRTFPNNQATGDGLGCNLQFQFGNKIYHVELKSPKADDTSFDLGLSAFG